MHNTKLLGKQSKAICGVGPKSPLSMCMKEMKFGDLAIFTEKSGICRLSQPTPKCRERRMRGSSGCKQLRVVPIQLDRIVSPPSRSLCRRVTSPNSTLSNLWFSMKLTIFRFWCVLCAKRKGEPDHRAPATHTRGNLE